MVSGCTPKARAAAAGTAALLVAACTPDPVAWSPDQERRVDAPFVRAMATGVVIPADTADSLLLRELHGAAGADARPAPVAVATLPPDPTGTRCPASLRLARAPRPSAPLVAAGDTRSGAQPAGADPHAGHGMPGVTMPAGAPAPTTAAGDGGEAVIAAWWAFRPDRSAALYLSRTGDGGRTWAAPLPVDTLDRSEAGCERPAPSVAADPVNGYVHVAYSMIAPEGSGVFYAHQMHPRAGFERPQAIVYGERPAATSVASRGDRVVVAYEDPNTGGRPFVSIALSRTAGHAWAERVPVTAGSVAAERPVVALRGRDQVVLGWVERTAPRTLATTEDPRAAVTALPSGVVVRVGRFRE